MATLNLYKRSEKGAALSSVEHDANFTLIEQAVNERVEEGDPRLTDAREPLSHTHAMSDVTGLDTALAAKAPVSTTVTTSNPALTDRRLPVFTLHNVGPAATDDIGEGYAVGHVWIDTVAGVGYLSRDSVDDAAKWIPLGVQVAQILSLLEDETDGLALASAIMTAMSDAPSEDKLAWLDAMFGTEILSEKFVAIAHSSDGALSIDGGTGLNFAVTLTANVTSVVPSNLIPGRPYGIEFIQGGSGGYTVAFGLNSDGNREVAVPSPAIDTEAGRIAAYTIFDRRTDDTPIYRVYPGPADA